MMHSLYGSLYHHDPLAAAAAVALMDPSLASSNNAAAAAAAATLNGGASTKDTTFTKIFVGGLPYHTTDKTLREYFEKYGDIEEAVVITDRQTGKSRGYGFVTMKDRTSAEQACKDPNPIIDGRKANVNLAYLGAKPRNNLQLAGLPLPLQASIPTLLPSRIGLPQLYYPSAPLLTSQGLVPVSSLAANQYLDYSTLAAAAAANQLNQAAAATSAANGASPAAYEPLSYTATAYGMVPTVSFAANQNAAASLGAAQGLTTANAAFAAAAYQAAAAAAAAANERQ